MRLTSICSRVTDVCSVQFHRAWVRPARVQPYIKLKVSAAFGAECDWCCLNGGAKGPLELPACVSLVDNTYGLLLPRWVLQVVRLIWRVSRSSPYHLAMDWKFFCHPSFLFFSFLFCSCMSHYYYVHYGHCILQPYEREKPAPKHVSYLPLSLFLCMSL